MRERLRAAAKSHVFAQVVSTPSAEVAVVTHDTGFNGDTLAGDEVLHTWPDGRDDACGFVTEYEGSLDSEIAVPAMEIIMH